MQIDGNFVDMLTIAVGVASVIIFPIRQWIAKRKPCFNRERAIIDMLNGAMLVPFGMMIGSVFSNTIMDEIIHSTKITLAISGVVGLIFVLGELFKSD